MTLAVSGDKGRTSSAAALSGLLICDQCGGWFGAVSRTKDGDKVYRNLGCVTHKSRGPPICAEGRTIIEKKAQTALVNYLQKNLSSPKLVVISDALIPISKETRAAIAPGSPRFAISVAFATHFRASSIRSCGLRVQSRRFF